MRLSSAFSLCSRLFSAAMSVVVPDAVPVSMCSCLCHVVGLVANAEVLADFFAGGVEGFVEVVFLAVGQEAGALVLSSAGYLWGMGLFLWVVGFLV